MRKKITILGAGAFGSAVATLLANNGFDVFLWCYEPEVARDINENHLNNRYLPGVSLHNNIYATSNMREAVEASHWIFEAIPLEKLRLVLTEAKPWVTSEHRMVILSKGIDIETFLLPSDIIVQALGRQLPTIILSGPNLAHELAQQVPSVALVAARDHVLVQDLKKMLRSPYFNVAVSDDPIGVQVCGAMKNVMAIALGVAYGVGCRENTIALLITQALREIARLCVALGGRAETAYGEAGLGDLALCCMGKASRNLSIGRLLGEAYDRSAVLAHYTLLPEGVGTLRAIKSISEEKRLDLPLSIGVYNFIFEQSNFDAILARLMNQ